MDPRIFCKLLFVLAREACNVKTASNGNIERGKAAYHGKTTTSLSRQANL